MKFSHDKPPMLDLILQRGMEPDLNRTCYTFGDVLYIPEKIQPEQLPPEFIAHEETHTKQQGNDPQKWWNRYLLDQYFRIEQEAEACAVQYLFFKHRVNHDRNAGARFLFQLAGQLAGPTYGRVVNQVAAQRMIQQYAGKLRI